MGRLQVFTPKKVMELTSNGRDVFLMELGHIPRKNIHSPLRTGDDDPSFQVKETKNGIWIGIDHNGSFVGNAISFVAERYSISYDKAIDKIVADLGLIKRTEVFKPIVKVDTTIREPKIVDIDFTDKPFTARHHLYWNRGHLEESFLRKNDIYAVGAWAINGTPQKIEDDEIVFAYYAPDIDKQKILRIGPNVNKKFKWRNTCPNTYLWGYKEITSPVDNLFVIKSRKDEMVLKFLGYDTTSVQNESATLFLTTEFGESNADKVLKYCKSPIINFGSDPQGVKESKIITDAIGCRWFNTQKHLVKKYDVNDNFGFACEFGLKLLDNLIKLKLKK